MRIVPGHCTMKTKLKRGLTREARLESAIHLKNKHVITLKFSCEKYSGTISAYSKPRTRGVSRLNLKENNKCNKHKKVLHSSN